MGAKSNTSTLLSSTDSSRHHHHRSGRYGVGAANRACAKNHRHNVAIATQVISPSAIGGSLSRNRFKQFGDFDDGESGFTRLKRRYPWGRIACYGISIVFIVLVMTGVVLAVSYMQAEKSRILSRSVKLVQEKGRGSSSSLPTTSTTAEVTSVVLPITTESPTTTPSDLTSNEANEEDDDIEELQILEPPPNQRNKAKKKSSAVKSEDDEGETEEDNKSDYDTEEVHRLPSEVKVLPPKDFTFDGFSFEYPIYGKNSTSEDELGNNRGTHTAEKNNKHNDQLTFSIDPIELESASLSPVKSFTHDFSLDGFNFSLDPQFPRTEFGTLSISNGSDAIDVPVLAKLQTDLFDDDSEPSASSNRGKGPPKPQEHDNGYTPRPNSVVTYSDKPLKVSAKTSAARKLADLSETLIHTEPENILTETSLGSDLKLSKLELPAGPGQVNEYSFAFSSPSINSNSNPSLNDYKLDYTTPISPISTTDLSLDLKNLIQGSDFKLNLPTSTDLNFDLSQFSTPTSTDTTNLAQDSQFSKRTFPYDTTSNHFAHLLTPSNPSSVIGLPSAAGANLNYNIPSYNFDFDSTPSPNVLNLPSGTIPINLAASHIQVSNPFLKSSSTPSNVQSTDNFGFGNPTWSLASIIQNAGGSANVDLGQGAGGYNTIQGGIQLLNLLSGNIPQHLIPEQQQQGSTSIQQYLASPQFQSPALTGLGGSGSAFGFNNPGTFSSPYLPAAAESRSLPVYADFHPTKTFGTDATDGGDQQPSESSFSQSIVKLHDRSSVNKGTENKHTFESSTISDALATPQSISMSILPNKDIQSLLTSFSKISNENEAKGSLALKMNGSKGIKDILKGQTRKKDASNHHPIADFLRMDMDASSSELLPQIENQNVPTFALSSGENPSSNFGKKLVIKTIKIKDEVDQRDIQERGLKSGFYV